MRNERWFRDASVCAENLVLEETDPFQPTQIIVARVEMSPVMPRCCVDQGVGKMKIVQEAIVGGFEAECLIYCYGCCLAKNCCSFQRLLLALCSLDPLVDLVNDNY